MNANEAIEKLRAALTAMVDEKCDYMRRKNLGNPEIEDTNIIARAALAATATIDPPGEAVGVEKAQQGDAIRPSAEPAGQQESTRDWLPIETAPKSLHPVWLGCHHSMRTGFWSDGLEYEHHGSIGGGWRDLETGRDLHFAPTSWMSLPPAPGASSLPAGSAREGGNTSPDSVLRLIQDEQAAQPAADHACPKDTPYGPAVCGECVDEHGRAEGEREAFDTYIADCQDPPIEGAQWPTIEVKKAWLIWQAAWQARGQQAGGAK